MKAYLLLGLMALVILISGCTVQNPVEQPNITIQETGMSIENLGGKYNGQLITIEGIVTRNGIPYNFTRYDINYTKNNRTMRGYFLPQLRPVLEWIRENTPENSVFFGWWDYGHMIQGFTGRDAVVFSPSRDMLWSVSSGTWDEEAGGPFASNEEIKDIASALLSSDSDDLADTMEKYNSSYAFIAEMDRAVMVYWLDFFNQDRYVDAKARELKDTASELLIFRMLNEESVDGFNLVYADNFAKVYERV